LDNQLGAWLKIKGGIVYDVMLVSPDNRIVYTVNPKHEAKYLGKPLPDPLNLAFEQGKKGLYITDVFKNEQENNAPAMLASGPAYDLEGNFAGVIVLEIDMAVLYEQLVERTDLGSTGEWYLINKDRLFISPSRFIENAVLNIKVDTENARRCFLQSGNGEENKEQGIWVFPDYRGIEVLGTHVYIPELQWGLLVEIDAAEAFAPINNLRTLSLIITMIVLALVITISFSTAQVLSKPIKALQKGAEIVGKGNLDYKVGTAEKDEIGQLSRAFDDMIGNLKKVTASRDELNLEIAERKRAEEEVRLHREHLESLVGERTAELKKANEQLQQEITERKKAENQIKASLKEKEILLQEVHHRVKNNMQIISSLFSLQSGHIKDKQALEIFKSSQNRVRSMALIHERLYQSKDLTRVDFAEYSQSLATHLFSSYGINTNVIKFYINIKDVFLDINTAIPCSLIINELVSNSLKHAFPGNKKGEIKIAANPLNENEVELMVSDNGVGLPKKVDFRKTDSLGLHLVNLLAEDQLHGDIKLDRKRGTSFSIRFKVNR
jgi:two-component sensor histidine kinase/HAMP domain-containing protein